jgi:hypothetical protein
MDKTLALIVAGMDVIREENTELKTKLEEVLLGQATSRAYHESREKTEESSLEEIREMVYDVHTHQKLVAEANRLDDLKRMANEILQRISVLEKQASNGSDVPASSVVPSSSAPPIEIQSPSLVQVPPSIHSAMGPPSPSPVPSNVPSRHSSRVHSSAASPVHSSAASPVHSSAASPVPEERQEGPRPSTPSGTSGGIEDLPVTPINEGDGIEGNSPLTPVPPSPTGASLKRKTRGTASDLSHPPSPEDQKAKTKGRGKTATRKKNTKPSPSPIPEEDDEQGPPRKKGRV